MDSYYTLQAFVAAWSHPDSCPVIATADMTPYTDGAGEFSTSAGTNQYLSLDVDADWPSNFRTVEINRTLPTPGMRHATRHLSPRSIVGRAKSVDSPGDLFVDYIIEQFTPHQQTAALNTLNWQQIHRTAVIPASLITAELDEVQGGRGWCLIGNCGVDRAKQKVKPQYDVVKDTTRKRLDSLYDHIRDKHFNCRPFRCSIPPWYV
jgi:hypothetical protein